MKKNGKMEKKEIRAAKEKNHGFVFAKNTSKKNAAQ